MFCLRRGEMKEKNFDTLCSNMNILIAELGVLVSFELKGNLTDFTEWNTGKIVDINAILYEFGSV